MKKSMILITVLAVIAGTMFTSCYMNGSQMQVLYKVTLSDDMAQVADLAITYMADDGATVTDTITGTAWEKKISLSSFPNQFGLVDYAFIPKPAGKLTKETYELEAQFSIFTREENLRLTHNLVNPFTAKRDKVASILDFANDHGDSSIIFTTTRGDKGLSFSCKSKLDLIYMVADSPQVYSPEKEDNDSTI